VFSTPFHRREWEERHCIPPYLRAVVWDYFQGRWLLYGNKLGSCAGRKLSAKSRRHRSSDCFCRTWHTTRCFTFLFLTAILCATRMTRWSWPARKNGRRRRYWLVSPSPESCVSSGPWRSFLRRRRISFFDDASRGRPPRHYSGWEKVSI